MVPRAMPLMLASDPLVWILDARDAGLDEPGLRSWAREQAAAAPAAHVSRCYRHPYALLACHDAPVGVDIERVERFDRGFLESICTPSERARLPRDADLDRYTASLWCSKEALSKALGDALRYDPRRLESPTGWSQGRAGPWQATALAAPPGHVAWLCWRQES